MPADTAPALARMLCAWCMSSGDSSRSQKPLRSKALENTIQVAVVLLSLSTIAHATPSIAFPYNAQVPSAGRVNAAYTFELSESTFASNTENLTYSLSQQPAWLTIDSATRTLMGTPGQGDVGSSQFVLSAADGTGAANMECTLVVSSDPAPQMDGDISKQLAATANLSSSHPPVVTLLPSTAFTFDFEQSSFIDIIQRKLYYYATLTDHTPLPSWLMFDSERLTFSGTAPELSAFPQSWSINLIASDVAGFAGTTSAFTIAIATHQLAFVPEEQNMNVMAGEHISFTALKSQLFLNSAQLDPKELRSANATLPSWLEFDPATLAIGGTVPNDFTAQNVSVTVSDQLGNTATAVVNLTPGNGSLFQGQVGTLVAQAGQAFTYQFSDGLFSEDNLNLMVAIPNSAAWLHFDDTTRTLEGKVPTSAAANAVQATLTAKPSGGQEGQSQIFTIDIKSAGAATESIASVASSASTTSSPTSSAGHALAAHPSHSHLSGGNIALIVVFSVLGSILLIALLFWCMRRRRHRAYGRPSPTPSKEAISRPIPSPENDGIVATTNLQHDVEKQADSVLDYTADRAPSPAPTREIEPPPQISLSIPTPPTNRRMKWSKRFSRITQVSSIGAGGEEMLRADTNIPDWGQQATSLNTPHDSFSVSAEPTRISRHLSNTSPSKRALRRLRNKHRSQDSVGLGISSIGSAGIPRHSSKRVNKHRRGKSSFGGLSTTREASSMASLSTRGTSVLSTRPSEFPAPPMSNHSTSLSVPTLSLFEADNHRKSIRLVERSDSIAAPDTRPFDQKRQSFIGSFIHNRASKGGIQSPLFAHASRASSTNVKTGSSNGSMRRSRASRSSRNILVTYSESSSLEPQPNDPRRSQTRETKRLSTKVLSAFPPSFPRVVTRSTVYADDEESSGDWTTSESLDDDPYWIAEASKPRHERTWVVPGEASPTPPPAPPTPRRPSTSRHSTPAAERTSRRQKSSSPLASHVQNTTDAVSSARSRRSRLEESLSLVSAESMNDRAKLKPAASEMRRPVSVDDVQRLSSMKAETDAATMAGSERWDDIDTDGELEGAGILSRPPSPAGGMKGNTTMRSTRSDGSGPAFL